MGRSRNLNPSQAALRNFLVMNLLFFDRNGETRREQRGKFGVHRARRDGRSIVRSQILSFPAKTECQITRRHAVVVSHGRPTRRHRTSAADHDPRGLVPRLAGIGSGGRIWPASAPAARRSPPLAATRCAPRESAPLGRTTRGRGRPPGWPPRTIRLRRGALAR